MNGSIPVLNEQGNTTYIDSEGKVVTDIIRKAQDSAPVSGSDTLDDDQVNPSKPVIEGGPIDPTTVTMIPGTNNITGFRLRDNETGEELPGKYMVRDKKYVPFQEGL